MRICGFRPTGMQHDVLHAETFGAAFKIEVGVLDLSLSTFDRSWATPAVRTGTARMSSVSFEHRHEQGQHTDFAPSSHIFGLFLLKLVWGGVEMLSRSDLVGPLLLQVRFPAISGAAAAPRRRNSRCTCDTRRVQHPMRHAGAGRCHFGRNCGKFG